MDNSPNLPAKARSTQVAGSPTSYSQRLKPADPRAVVGLLTACLALVRPVGMQQADADTWLRVAAGEVAHIPFELLDEACRVARRTCTHHAQIVPTIIRESSDHLAMLQTLGARRSPDEVPALPTPPIIPPAPEEVRELAAVIGKAADKFRAVESDRWAERRAERAALYPTVKVDPNAPRTLAELVARMDARDEGEVLQ